jgi:hypothetical protein
MRSLGRAGSIILALVIMLAATPAMARASSPRSADLLGPIIDPIDDLTDSLGSMSDEDDPLPLVANELLEPVISAVDQTTDTVTGLISDTKPPVTTPVPVTTTLPIKPEPTVPGRPDPTLPSPTTTVPIPTTTALPRPTPTTTPVRDLVDSRGIVAPVVQAETAFSAVPDLPAPADEERVAPPQQTETSYLAGILDFVRRMDLASFLAAPLLALEVLLRALASAGEGLLAPVALLVLLAAALRRDHRFSGTKTP